MPILPEYVTDETKTVLAALEADAKLLDLLVDAGYWGLEEIARGAWPGRAATKVADRIRDLVAVHVLGDGESAYGGHEGLAQVVLRAYVDEVEVDELASWAMESARDEAETFEREQAERNEKLRVLEALREAEAAAEVDEDGRAALYARLADDTLPLTKTRRGA